MNDYNFNEILDNKINIWCDIKYHEVMEIIGTNQVNIYIYAYDAGEYVVCDFTSINDKNKYVDTTFNMGVETNLEHLHSPWIENTEVLFNLLDKLNQRFTGAIFFGQPSRK
ncbi:hypothetical protein P7V44_21740 [Providencia sp. CRE-3FA-0001]|uniref:Uncharacterized protein n=1 Tax=Providencia huashanensis TaxID=3037798 RepID=A0AA42FT51_9GAMM|nr:hypothetical protein [Providencia sp. CRE-3FA-0001]MDG4698850.1 hypothetical protein [Providencia sp. CRE-3FA-0001]